MRRRCENRKRESPCSAHGLFWYGENVYVGISYNMYLYDSLFFTYISKNNRLLQYISINSSHI
jgi:hypothetical protein